MTDEREIEDLARELFHVWKNGDRNFYTKGIQPELLLAVARHIYPRLAMTWQPIETAPKDGTEVLLWTADGHIIGFFARSKYLGEKPFNNWTTGRETAFGYDVGYAHIAPPTHWMPLPDPPAAGEKQ